MLSSGPYEMVPRDIWFAAEHCYWTENTARHLPYRALRVQNLFEREARGFRSHTLRLGCAPSVHLFALWTGIHGFTTRSMYSRAELFRLYPPLFYGQEI